MIVLYHAYMSRSTRVLWLLEELGADYKLVPISIMRPDGSGGPDGQNPHPLKQVPAIEHDGVLIVESLAIWLHLSDSFPKAELAPKPDDPARTDYMGWIGSQTAIFEPLVAAAMKGEAFSAREEAARDWLDSRFQAALSRAPYLLGENFSTADLLYSSMLRFYPSVLPDRPAYKDWLARINERPALARVRAIETDLMKSQPANADEK